MQKYTLGKQSQVEQEETNQHENNQALKQSSFKKQDSDDLAQTSSNLLNNSHLTNKKAPSRNYSFKNQLTGENRQSKIVPMVNIGNNNGQKNSLVQPIPNLQNRLVRDSRLSVAHNKNQQNKISYDYTHHNVEVLEDGRVIFRDIREEMLTKKVENALIKVQQIDNQKYAIKLLGLKHFLIKLSRFTHSHMAKHLTKYQKTVIKDLSLAENNSSNARDQKNKDEDDSKLGIIEKIILLIPLFNPSNTFIVIWDIFQVIFILFFFFAIPLQIVFNLGLGKFISDEMFNTGIVLFVIDNILCINTTYFDKGVPVQDRILIWNHYLRKHFVTDFLSNIPVLIDYFFINLQGWWGFIMLIQYLKVDRITIIIRKVEERFHLSPKQQQLVRLGKLLFRMLFVAHIFACMWLYLALTNQDDTQVWLDKYNYNTASWNQQYLVAYYYTTVTMITVGYGDFTPVNNREFCFSVVTMLVCCGVFAYGVNQIGSIFENISKQDRQITEMMYSISSYMHLKKVSKELQYQIREYLQYYWTEQQDRDTEVEEKIKSQLSDNLKDQLALEANNIVLKDSVVFINNFSNQVISKTVPLIKEYRATPDEIILIENTVTEDQNIYFIEKGQVEVYMAQSDQPIQIMKLKAGDCFGQVGFFTGLSRTLSVKSLDFTTLIYIKRSEFMELIKEYPEDYEQFCFIRDKILNESDYRLIGMKCYSCKDGKHLTNECPYLHFTPKRLLLLKKYFYPGSQVRQKQERKKITKTQNSRKQRGKIQEKAEEIQEQFSIIIDDLFGDDDLFDSEKEHLDEEQLDRQKSSSSEDQSDVKLPSFLQANFAKKASIDGRVEISTSNKIEETSQMEESVAQIHSTQKVSFQQSSPKQFNAVQQQFFPTNNAKGMGTEDVIFNMHSEKNYNSGNLLPQVNSIHQQNEQRSDQIMALDNNEVGVSTVDQSKIGFLNLPKESIRKKAQSTQKSYPSQNSNHTRETRELGNSQTLIPPNMPTSSASISRQERKSVKKMTRQESRRKSTKKQLMNNNIVNNFLNLMLKKSNSIKEESIYSKSLSSQTSKLEALTKQMTKYKMTSTLGNPPAKQHPETKNLYFNHGIESLKRISQNQEQNQFQIQLLQKILEAMDENNGQQHQRKSLDQDFFSVIEGSDNQTNFYGLEDFDTLRNYTFYYPSSNAEYVIDKFMSIKSHRTVKQNLFMQLNKLKPTTIQQNSPLLNQQEYMRKNRKTGGTRIIAAGGATGNLLSKFRQQEESQTAANQNEETESYGISNQANNLGVNGDSSPFVRGGARKTTKRQNIAAQFSIAAENNEVNKLTDDQQGQVKKSKFQNDHSMQFSQIEEDENEYKRLSQTSQHDQKILKKSCNQDSHDLSKPSFKNMNFEEILTNSGNEQELIFKPHTFSKLPSSQSINENGHLPNFQNLQCIIKHNVINQSID